MKIINKNSYLLHAHEKLKNIQGCLFIFGYSLNCFSDKHIIHSIKNNSNIEKIFIGIYNNSLDPTHCKELFSSKEVYIFDSKEIAGWSEES